MNKNTSTTDRQHEGFEKIYTRIYRYDHWEVKIQTPLYTELQTMNYIVISASSLAVPHFYKYQLDPIIIYNF